MKKIDEQIERMSRTYEEVIGEFKYTMIAVLVHNNYESIECRISKQVMMDMSGPEGIQPVAQDFHIGVIRQSNGRTLSEINTDEDDVTHLIQFKEFVKQIQSEGVKK